MQCDDRRLGDQMPFRTLKARAFDVEVDFSPVRSCVHGSLFWKTGCIPAVKTACRSPHGCFLPRRPVTAPPMAGRRQPDRHDAFDDPAGQTRERSRLEWSNPGADRAISTASAWETFSERSAPLRGMADLLVSTRT